VHTRERGFTLIEVVIGVAIIAMTVAAGITLSLASQPAAVSMTAARFDALLDAARTEARAYDTGVTIAFTASGSGGFHAQLYRGRPAVGSLVALNIPAIEATVAVNESEVLHAPAFALTIRGDGSVGGIVGYAPPGTSASPETACPASGAYHFVFSASGRSTGRYLPCRIALAATAPATYASLLPGGSGGTPAPGSCVSAACATAPPPQTSTCPPLSFLGASGCIESPLVVSPASVVIPRAGAAAVVLSTTEADYSGPFQVTSSSCAPNTVAITGGGSGPSSAFSVTSSQEGVCSFAIADDHGDAKTIAVTTYGPLSVSPAALSFVFPASPQTFTAHEDYYSGQISVSVTKTSAQNDPGCEPYVTLDSSTRNTDSSWNAAFAVSPTAVVLQCEVTLSDDHGGTAQIAVHVQNPIRMCPDGTIVGLGMPCPSIVVASSTTTMSFRITCKQIGIGDLVPGMAILTVTAPTPQSFTLGAAAQEVFVAAATMPLASADPVTFQVSSPQGSTARLAVSTSGTQSYKANALFSDAGTWNGSTWTPPHAGTFFIGYVQDYASPDCNGTSGSNLQPSTVYDGTFSATATQS
jgi:prepilin-type N-terminal cleavage/methylation domain-containing protein